MRLLRIKHILTRPHKNACHVLLWINHQRDLPRLAKEVPMNEKVHLREEDIEAGVSMIPTNHLQTRIHLLTLAIEITPSIVGECQVTTLLSSITCLNRM